MDRRVTMAILAAAALLIGGWTWAPPNVWAQQGMGPAGRGLMIGQTSQSVAATGSGMMGQAGGTGPGWMGNWGYDNGMGLGPLGWLFMLLVGELILAGVVLLGRRRPL
jgi:hypothetical protein